MKLKYFVGSRRRHEVKKAEGLLAVEIGYIEIEAPDDGVLKEIKAQEDDCVKCRAVDALIKKAMSLPWPAFSRSRYPKALFEF
jgi:hypothetical protein